MSLNKLKDKKVLITGGLGFIGSNLAIQLVEVGAKVTLVDAMLPLYGGNIFNIQNICDKVTVNYADIRDIPAMNQLVRNQDYIFHLAGQVSHVDSIKDPFTDLDINAKGTLVLLEACRNYNRDVKIVFTGTRGEYGPGAKLPINESTPLNPRGIYSITNLTAEKMLMAYNEIHHIRTICLRIANTYGPRHQMKHDHYGVLNWFIRQVIDNKPIKVFGEGAELRDFLYIDDTVRAILRVATAEQTGGEVYNVGNDKAISFIDLTNKIIKIAGTGRYEFSPFTEERKALGICDYSIDYSKINRAVGWKPEIGLDEGIRQTIDFYRKYKKCYW